MPILSDAQIEALCVPPSIYFDQASYLAAASDPMRPWPLHPQRREEIRRAIEADHTRPTTEEERAAFVPMIEPFHSSSIRRVEQISDPYIERKIISKGLSSYGYDVSLSDKEVKIFTNINSTIINPKKLDERCLVDAVVHTDEEDAKYVILPPNSYMLGKTNEYFRMPRDVLAVCLGKSTYARACAIVNVTPIEPGFNGEVVIEISNGSSLPLMVFLNEGIGQFLFFRGTEPCRVSYADRGGKYQGQTGVTLPKV